MSIERYGAEMTDDDLAGFLESRGVGTLALGTEDGGYGIPMSFGFDRSENRCILQFAFGTDSTKKQFIDKGNQVSLSVFEWNGVDDWQSVVVRGSLQPVPEQQTVKVAGIFAAHAKIPSLEVFRQPIDELDLEWYEPQICEVHGRQSTLDP